MKTREQIYSAEANGLLRDITSYHYMRHDQLLKMYPGKESKIDNLLRHLVKQGRIQYDAAGDMYHDGSAAGPNEGTLAALWVLIDFIDKAEYHSPTDFPALLGFMAEGEYYEVLYIANGSEALTEYALMGQNSNAGSRIVIVEGVEQIPQLTISGVRGYCTVDVESGTVHYFKQVMPDG